MQTLNLLDKEFIAIGDMQKRNEEFNRTFTEFKSCTTPRKLFEDLKQNVDNPAILKLMEEDLESGFISGIIDQNSPEDLQI